MSVFRLSGVQLVLRLLQYSRGVIGQPRDVQVSQDVAVVESSLQYRPYL